MKAIINRQARYNYEFLDKFEAGLVLRGHEVKAIKDGQIDLKGSFIKIKTAPKLAAYLQNATVSLYKKASKLEDYDPQRPKKLLLSKKEILSISQKLEQKGLTLVPIKVYTKNNRIKLEIALAKGKSKIDKRDTIKKRDSDRQIRRLLKNY